MAVVTSLPANKQEFLDLMIEKFKQKMYLAQKIESGGCVYRGPNGEACHIGLLIPDSEYRPIFEGHFVHDLMSAGWFAPPAWITPEELTEVQGVHDTITPERSLEEYIKQLLSLSAFEGMAPSCQSSSTP